MNLELKAILDLIFDAVIAGEHAIQKKSFAEMLPDIYKIVADVPAVVVNHASFMAEIKALPGSEQEKDLIAYVVQKFALVDNDAKAQKILSASLMIAEHAIVDIMALVEAIKA